MKHLVRAGGLFLAVILLVFVVPRIMPVASYLEEYGFHPKDDEKNTREWASLPVQFVESSACGSCHRENHLAWKESKHSTVSCEDCHGPGKAHIEKRVALTVDSSRESCGLCHARVLARPESFPQVVMKEHGGVSRCTTCHNPHNPGLKARPATAEPAKPGRAATLPVIPHTLEGRTNCLLCHNTGGIKPFPENHKGRSQDTCLTCHQSK